jgi:hypothetical protein
MFHKNILSVCFARRRGAAYDPRTFDKEMSLFVKGIPVGTTSYLLKTVYVGYIYMYI